MEKAIGLLFPRQLPSDVDSEETRGWVIWREKTEREMENRSDEGEVELRCH